jgi:hypothetical protein
MRRGELIRTGESDLALSIVGLLRSLLATAVLKRCASASGAAAVKVETRSELVLLVLFWAVRGT